MAKRKARAERFGTAAAPSGEAEGATEDSEAARALERAKRFGTGQNAVGKLDEALPEERERGSRKRGRTDETSAMDDPALRRGFGGRGRGRGGRLRDRGGRDNSRRRTGEKPAGVSKSGAFSTDADRLAAEARKKKFAAAT
jgi:SAP domain-containing ribonucleoprotein